MRHVRRAVEQLVNTMTAVRLDNGAVLCLCVLFNDVSGVAEEHARFDDLNGLVQALSRSLYYADSVRVS